MTMDFASINSIVTEYVFDDERSYLLVSTIAFITVRILLQQFSIIPALRITSSQEIYYWFNVLGSLIHSVISGSWCLLCFYRDRELLLHLIEDHNRLSYALVAVSTGYFIYDFIDNVVNFSLSRVWEILFHHVVVVTCFGIALVTDHYIGYAVLSLLVEVNSVFLHIRQLMRLANIPPSSWQYKCVAVVNLGTFIVFRLCTLVYMAFWLATAPVQWVHRSVGIAGMFVMIVMNAVLLYRLVIKDFLGRDSRLQRLKNKPQGVKNGFSKKYH